MKTSFIALCLLMLTLPLLAQTGLFGLSYGQSRTEAASILKEHAFLPSASEANVFQRVDSDVYFDTVVWLYFTPNDPKMKAWLIEIYVEDTEDLIFEDEMLDQLYALHGVFDDYDDLLSEGYWQLDETRFLNTSFDDYYVNYYLYYGDSQHAEFDPY